MTIKHRVRRWVQSRGLDVTRFPGSRPEVHRTRLLNHHAVNKVLDVGANQGQFGSDLRRFGFGGEIVSFEPLSEAYDALAKRASRDSRWRSVQCALGDYNGHATLNVAGNHSASSSILAMLERHSRAAPQAGFVAEEEVEVRRLDDVAPEYILDGDVLFLKLDVQGYEMAVLRGASQTLPRLVGLQMELSLVPLYEGGLDFMDALRFMSEQQFVLSSLEPGFTDPNTGQLLQVDGVFFKA